MLNTSALCFIACHGGSADHFATFTENFPKNAVEVFATGAGLKKFQERGVTVHHPFSIEGDEDALAEKIAKTCSKSVVITDVGHPFDVKLQKAFNRQGIKHLCYYDNPEPFVPGGYSATASKVMQASQGVLFANANLVNIPIEEEPGQFINLDHVQKIGLGYYPTQAAEKIKGLRTNRYGLRQQIFTRHKLEDKGQKVFVYFGGNNEEYFKKAFPAFLKIISTLDLSDIVFFIQLHPAAKEKNIEASLITSLPLLLSDFSSDEAQIIADCAFYYQTSMCAQFALSGIPVVQIGHEPYLDLLVKNGLCPSIVDEEQLANVILKKTYNVPIPKDVVLNALGVRDNWLDILKRL